MAEKKSANSQPERDSSSRASRLFGALVVASSLVAVSSVGVVSAETPADRMKNEKQATAYEADNSGKNVRDQSDNRETADDQIMNSNETEVLATVRREIVANDSLSTYGKNVKILLKKGVVTLRGPVKSMEEKTWIETATKKVAFGYTVMNQLEVDKG